MKKNVDYKGYDTLIQSTDWRYSAACLGLHRFLTYSGFDFMLLNDCEDTVDGAIYGFDGILYHSSDLTEENYLLFAESYFRKYMTHLTILSMLKNAEFTDENIKTINDLIKSKTVLKKLIGKTKFDGTNKDVISNLINENRFEITKNIFRNGKNLYSDYCNKSLLLTDGNKNCRLAGYTVDKNRKSNSLGFCFDKNSFTFEDKIEFDFIPFAFSNPNMEEKYFINNNYSINNLVKTNDEFSSNLFKYNSYNAKEKMFTVLKNSGDYINYDVEIIIKNNNNDFFNTLFVRKERLENLTELNYKNLEFIFYITENNVLNVKQEVCERCLNNVLLDDIIRRMLKIYFIDKDAIDSKIDKELVFKVTNTLIDINASWKGKIDMMNENTTNDQVENKQLTEVRFAYSYGRKVSKKLKEMGASKKINAYRLKLSTAITVNDYTRVCDVLLNLSNYTGIVLPFLLDFYENPEENENVIYSFVNNLMDFDMKKDKEENNGDID